MSFDRPNPSKSQIWAAESEELLFPLNGSSGTPQRKGDNEIVALDRFPNRDQATGLTTTE